MDIAQKKQNKFFEMKSARPGRRKFSNFCFFPSLFVVLSGLIISCSSSQKMQGEIAQEGKTTMQDTGTTGDRVTPGVNLNEKLPVTAKVSVDTLENGLTYYIRKNSKPENRAELRLVVNAGSILEDDSQLGLAHFVEHMAFNGTKNFKKHELLDFLESFGMRLGPDLNAYTSFDETVYMLHLPTDSLELMQNAFKILREWATNLSFEDEEIDKERGVIIEEWRLGRGADARMRDEQFPILFKGSRYADRLPIGKVNILENFEYQTLKSFYHDWYRPDLMAVVAVGDFDPAQVKQLIVKNFAEIPSEMEPRPRLTFDVPDNKEPLFAIASDPEANRSTLMVLYKQDKEDETTVEDYRESLTGRLYNGMFNERLSELTQSTDPPFIFGASGKGAFVRAKDFYVLQALVRGDEFDRALETLLTEAKRVKQYGFTQTEFERQKTQLLRHMEQAFKERDKTESRQYAAEYIRNFLSDEPIPGIEYEYEITRKLLPTISMVEVNKLADKWISDENRVVMVSGPEKEGVTIPTEEELAAVFKSVESKEVAPYKEEVSDEPLISELPAAGKIVGEESNEKLGVTTLTLSNGARVVLKPTDFKNDEILFAAYSPGGTSLAEKSRYIPADFASNLVNQSGIGDFGPIELQKKLAGKVVRVFPSIGSLEEGFSGSVSPEDMETLFKLTHLYFTAPRIDSVAFVSYRKRLSDYLKNVKLDPESAFRDTIQVTMSQHHYRTRPLSQSIIDSMNMTESLDFYKERFADAGDFIFYFVGSFNNEKIKPLIEKYLANLPAVEGQETWRDVGIRPPKGIIKKTVYRGLEPKSQVRINFTGPFDFSIENRRIIRAMADVLNLKLREVLREDMGGTYGVSVSASPSEYPVEDYTVRIRFGCDPERVEEMVETVFQQIDSLKNFGTTEKYLQKVREKGIRQHEENLKENRYWIQSLEYYDKHQENPEVIVEGPDPFLDQLNSEMIQNAAKEYFNEKNYALFVLKPQKPSE